MRRAFRFILTFIVAVPLVWGAIVLGYLLLVEEWRLIEVSSREGANAMGLLFFIAPACALVVGIGAGLFASRRGA